MANLTTIVLSASGSVTSSGSFSTIDNTFGTAGTSNSNVATVQGISGMTAVITTLSGTGNVALTGTGLVSVVASTTITAVISGTANVSVVNGVTSVVVTGTSNVALTGTGTVAIAGTTAVSVVNANANGRNTSLSSAPVVLASQTYTSVAASASATLLGSSGAVGDWLDGILVVPSSVSPGAVSIADQTTSITIVAGGTTSLTNLVPFYVPIGAVSRLAGWHVTTGSSIAVIAQGNFT